MKSGIYKITNLKNGNSYIGSAVKIQKRWITHLAKLNNQYHDNQYLQNAWNKYGNKCFKFEVLSYCPKEYLIRLEQWFLDNFKSVYNIRKIAKSNFGLKWSTDKTRKRGESVRGVKRPDVSIKSIGNKYNFGKRRDKTYKDKLSETLKSIYKSYTIEQKDKVDKARFNNAKRRKIMKFNLLGEFVEEYNSIIECSSICNISQSSIYHSLLGKSKKPYSGYVFKYKN